MRSDTISGVRGRGRLTALALVATIISGACTVGAAIGDKVGGGGEPVVLKMASGYGLIDYVPPVAYFATRVGELSRGTLRVEVVDSWGNSQADFEQRIVGDVATGKADLGWVGTEVFDTLGVRSFQALTAPMLIDSYPLERKVIASDIPGQMLKSLSKLRVTGLAVLGEGLRKPVAVEHPLLGPADWRGITFAAFRSQGHADAIRALGARPTDIFGSVLDDALAKGGQVQGLDKDLHKYFVRQWGKLLPYITANVNLWPLTIALLANPERLSGLTAGQRGWLLQAAREATTLSTSLAEDDARYVPMVCFQGARLANASAADLAGMGHAFLPAYATLEQDPQTKAFIAQIQALKRSTPAGPQLSIPENCTGSPPSAPTDDPLEGAWHTGRLGESRIVRAFIAAGGSERDGRAFVFGDGLIRYEIVTITFHEGQFLMYVSADGRPSEQGDQATYHIGDDGILTKDDPFGDCTDATYRIELRGDTLRLHVLRPCQGTDAPYQTTLYASFPFTRTR